MVYRIIPHTLVEYYDCRDGVFKSLNEERNEDEIREWQKWSKIKKKGSRVAQ